nr:dihydrogenase [uncultured bacterium]
MHLEAWLAAGACVRIHSLDGRAEELVQEFDGFGVKAVGSLDEALDGVDAVDICSPTDTHRDIALAAIARGVAVVCEKPLAADVAEAEEIVGAAEKAGVPVYPAHDIRFAPAFARLHELVAEGRLGAGTVARFTVAGYHPRPWTGHATAESGGILTDQMLHGVDIAYWLFGDVVRVHAHYQGEITAPAPQGTAAVGTVVLTHAGGALSQVVSRWTPTPQPPIRVTFHVSGTGGRSSTTPSGPRRSRCPEARPGRSATTGNRRSPPRSENSPRRCGAGHSRVSWRTTRWPPSASPRPRRGPRGRDVPSNCP